MTKINNIICFLPYIPSSHNKEFKKIIFTSVTKLVEQLKVSEQFIKLISDIKISTKKTNILLSRNNNTNIKCFNTTNMSKEINENVLIPSNLYGVFFDYLLRITFSLSIRRKFYDNRCDKYFSSFHEFSKNNSLYCEKYHQIENKFSCIHNRNLKEFDNGKLFFYCKCSNKNCVPFRKIFLSYEKIRNYTFDDINSINISDVFNVSICHFLVFNNYEYCKYLDIKVGEYDRFNTLKYVQSKIQNIKNDEILLNPVLNQTITNSKHIIEINAEADIILGNELIDIKCSKYEIGDLIIDYIQLIVYAALYYNKSKIKCDKLTIFNPVIGYEKTIIIDNKLFYHNVLDVIKLIN